MAVFLSELATQWQVIGERLPAPHVDYPVTAAEMRALRRDYRSSITESNKGSRLSGAQGLAESGEPPAMMGLIPMALR